MKNLVWLFWMLIIEFHVSTGWAQTPENMRGAWTLDAKATEEFVIATLPHKDAGWFEYAAGFMVGTVYEIDADRVVVHLPGGVKRLEYLYQSEQGNEIVYVGKDPQGKAVTLTISPRGESLKIMYAGHAQMRHLMWKRTDLPPGKTTSKEWQEETNAWIASLQKIWHAFEVNPSSTEEWDDEALLNDGRTVEVRRKVAFYKSRREEYSLQVKHPDTGVLIQWNGELDVRPLLLDFVNGVPYLGLFAEAPFYTDTSRYGCPELPFVFVRYDEMSAKWSVVPLASAPLQLKQVNLSAQYDRYNMKNGARQSKQDIQSRNKVSRIKDVTLTSTIPRNTGEWAFSQKARFLNKRYKNDCRPTLPLPVDAIGPASVTPAHQDLVVERLEDKTYDPAWVIKTDLKAQGPSEWNKLTWDQLRRDACKEFLRPADLDQPQLDGWGVFVKDPSGTKMTPLARNRLCDASAIWIFEQTPGRVGTVITKISPQGDVIYRASLGGTPGQMIWSKFKAEGGYLYFEWWSVVEQGHDRYVSRSVSERVREPISQK